VIVPGPQDEIEKPVVYEDGETDPLSSLVDEPPILATESGFEQSDVAETQSNSDAVEDDPDAAIGAFVSACLVEDEGSTVTTGDVYDAYMEWAEARNVPVESKNWFARRLGDHIDFERTSEYRDGVTVRCYEGIALTEENQ
jgi:phage/plasmid-associated DNA primase